ncbi:hypothetical protein [Georgenia wangjunii]|uniref:8-oxoguanine DNA glycosylase OGG fold protein n=1 Tax=Georgenia wangjunii TaxID=3117730 RepID=UPI002F26DA47
MAASWRPAAQRSEERAAAGLSATNCGWDGAAVASLRSMKITRVPDHLRQALERPAPQSAFMWKPSAWIRQMQDRPEVIAALKSLPDRIDRDVVRQAVLRELDGGRTFAAFVPAMVWGYGTSGRGPLRSRWVLTGNGTRSAGKYPVLASVAQHLEEGAAAARTEGPLAGFRVMNNEARIKHLGPSFFTKWLYFASAVDSAIDHNAAPVFDMRVRDWIARHARVSLRLNKTPDYSQYLDLLRAWGQPYDLSRVEVETEIFRLATRRG